MGNIAVNSGLKALKKQQVRKVLVDCMVESGMEISILGTFTGSTKCEIGSNSLKYLNIYTFQILIV